jgi:hypothetical protein
MKIGGDVPIGGFTFFPTMSKGEKDKDQKNADMGSIPKGRYPFLLMSKRERSTIREK